MFQDLFIPNGSTNSTDFIYAAWALVIVMLVIDLTGYTIPLVGLIVKYCWVILFIRRLNDGGWSRSTVILPCILYCIWVPSLLFLVSHIFAPDLFSQIIETAKSDHVGDTNIGEERLLAQIGPEFENLVEIPFVIAYAAMSIFVAWAFSVIIGQQPTNNYNNNFQQRIQNRTQW